MKPERLKQLENEAKQEIRQERILAKIPNKNVNIQSTVWPTDFNPAVRNTQSAFNTYQQNIKQQLLAIQVAPFNYQKN